MEKIDFFLKYKYKFNTKFNIATYQTFCNILLHLFVIWDDQYETS